MMECSLYPEQYRIIYKISFLSLGTSMYALYNGHYDLSICSGGAFLTSINFWRYPDYSWRRYLDMIYVKLALCYQLYRAYRSTNMIYYYILTSLAVSMYPLGIYYHKQKLFWYSTYAHCALHIIANIANLFLYSAKIS